MGGRPELWLCTKLLENGRVVKNICERAVKNVAALELGYVPHQVASIDISVGENRYIIVCRLTDTVTVQPVSAGR